MGRKQNKKAGGRANKKKKSQGNRTRDSISTSNRQTLGNIGNLPTFHNENTSNISRDGIGGIYERYKKCTRDFRDWMKKILPSHKLDTVNDLSKGVDQIFDKNLNCLEELRPDDPPIVAPSDVMKSLSTSIHYREMMTETRYGDKADAGHKYMVETLKYCRQMLRFSRRVARVAIEDENKRNADDKESVDAEIGGRFNALVMDDSDDEDESAEIDFERIRQRRFPDITAPEEPETQYSIEQDLINGDDRFQSCAFLETMEDLMGLVYQHYELLKMTMRGQGQHETSSCLQLLMECTVVTNMATKSLLAMEASLFANHPHLTSFYRVLAVVLLSPLIADIQVAIKPDALKKEPHLAKMFAGDIVECAFHNKGEQMKKTRTKRFVNQSGMPLKDAEKFAKQISTAAAFEVQLAMEEPMNTPLNALARAHGLQSHVWFRNNPHLGGDLSILNTQNLVQKILDIVRDNTKLVPKPGIWGPMFDEHSNPASRIRGDMDELFAADILPELIEICKRAPIKILPNAMELMPVMDLLATQMQNRESPVPISLTFGFHAMLSSFLVLQGEGDLHRIATYSKCSYHKLFEQLEEMSKSDLGQPPSFHQNVSMFKSLVNLAKPIPPVGSRTSEDNAFWNPVIGGEYLLFATYICSIGLGSATVDCFGQLRFTLHLYNALRKRELIADISFLSAIDKVFEKTKAVWVGGRPEKGTFAKHFWLAWGMSIAEASRLADSSLEGTNDNLMQRGDTTRELDVILPEEYSDSYRRIVLRDFEDEENDYTVVHVSDEQRKRYQGLFDVMTRVNTTRDSMDEDEDMVIPTNFTVIGCILNEFVFALSKNMGWDPMIRNAIASCPDDVRNGVRTSGRRPKVGVFETSDLNLEWQALAHAIASLLGSLDKEPDQGAEISSCRKAATFMTTFFQDIPKERYKFFVDENTNTAAAASPPAFSNPLEGSYPYGRTGKTAEDPLAAFFHFKYSKGGKFVARLIKPGKRTPYNVHDGEVITPYTEVGSKLVRQPNGRYRHIASYSLEELLALGWDGAKYNSKGYWVPFIPGYDSDPDDSYDPVDYKAGRRTGLFGLTPDEVGLYMSVPTRGIVQLNAGH